MGIIDHELLCNLDDIVGDDSELIYYGINILDEKEFKKFIQKMEFLCRKSQEYDVWQKRTKMLAVHQNPDPAKCDSEKCPKCDISYEYAAPESHHHPITLFNLVVGVFQKWIDNNELDDKQPLDLVFEVMFLHLSNKVEHVVLCKHCHERYHNGEITTREELDKIIEYKREQFKLTLTDEKLEEANLKKLLRDNERKERNQFRSEVLNLNPEIVNESELMDLINNRDISFAKN